MQRLPRPTLVIWLCLKVLVSIMALFVTSVTFDLMQIIVTLLLFFLDSSDITANDGSIRRLASLNFAVGTRILVGLTQTLPGLAFIFTITLVSR